MQETSSSSIWSVQDLTLYLKDLIGADALLRNVWIRGEISNFKHHSRGHMYFTIKDEHARILAVMFQGYNRFLRFTPKDGLKVLVRGEVSIYERDGQYQLYVKEMQADGVGNLYIAYEQLKSKLAQEGLFDPVHKRKLPRFPQRIALITSPTGAAIRDMMTTLQRRYPLAELLVIPVLVQGEYAPSSIVNAIQLANRHGIIDVIILGRGGGSIEELWAFNEEVVARGIFQSQIPIISAVGHETDYTISDFVADIRAATPTAAAEIAVPHLRELEEQLKVLKHRLFQSVYRYTKEKRERLQQYKRSTAFRKPLDRLYQHEQHLDRLTDSLKRFARLTPNMKRTPLNHLRKRLIQTSIPQKVAQEREHITSLRKRLNNSFQKNIQERKVSLGYLMHQLDALSPLSILKKGYAIAIDTNQQLVKSVQQLSPGEVLQVHFIDGMVETSIWAIKEEESLWQKNKQNRESK